MTRRRRAGRRSGLISLCRAVGFLGAAALAPSGALAQWRLDGAWVCTVGGAQLAPAIVSDGAGGAILA